MTTTVLLGFAACEHSSRPSEKLEDVKQYTVERMVDDVETRPGCTNLTNTLH